MGSPVRRHTNPITRCWDQPHYRYAGTDDGRGADQRLDTKRLTLMSGRSSKPTPERKTHVTRGGVTHVVHRRGSQIEAVWPGCVYAWLCMSATVEGLARGRACWAAGQIWNRPTPVNGCPERIGHRDDQRRR